MTYTDPCTKSFARGDVPRHAFNAAQGVPNHPSPAGTDGSTPSAISILSPPQMQSGPSPAAAQSPLNAPTPTTMAIRRKTMDNRAASLLGGRYGDFLGGMSAAELRSFTSPLDAWTNETDYFTEYRQHGWTNSGTLPSKPSSIGGRVPEYGHQTCCNSATCSISLLRQTRLVPLLASMTILREWKFASATEIAVLNPRNCVGGVFTSA